MDLYYKNKYLKYKHKYYQLYTLLGKNNYKTIKGGADPDCPVVLVSNAIIDRVQWMIKQKITYDVIVIELFIFNLISTIIEYEFKNHNFYFKKDISKDELLIHLHLYNYNLFFEKLIKEFLRNNKGTTISKEYPCNTVVEYNHNMINKLLKHYNVSIQKSTSTSTFTLKKLIPICMSQFVLTNTCGSCLYISCQMCMYFSDLFRDSFLLKMDQLLNLDTIKITQMDITHIDSYLPIGYNISDVSNFFKSLIEEYNFILDIYTGAVKDDFIYRVDKQTLQIENFCKIYKIQIKNFSDIRMYYHNMIIYINLILAYFVNKKCCIKKLAMDELSINDINNDSFLGIILASNGHASAVYKCNENLVYFNNGHINVISEPTDILLNLNEILYFNNEYKLIKTISPLTTPDDTILYMFLLSISDIETEVITQKDIDYIVLSIKYNILINKLTSYSYNKILKLIEQNIILDDLMGKIESFSAENGILTQYNVVSAMIIYHIMNNYKSTDIEKYKSFFKHTAFIERLCDNIKGDYLSTMDKILSNDNIKLNELSKLICCIEDKDSVIKVDIITELEVMRGFKFVKPDT